MIEEVEFIFREHLPDGYTAVIMPSYITGSKPDVRDIIVELRVGTMCQLHEKECRKNTPKQLAQLVNARLNIAVYEIRTRMIEDLVKAGYTVGNTETGQ